MNPFAPPGDPPPDSFAPAPPGDPPPDPLSSDPFPPELMNGPLPDNRDGRSSSFLLPDVSGPFVPPPPVPASFGANGPDLASDSHDTYAIEMRAESIDMLSLGNATRRGELDRVEIGDGEGGDSVAGEETAQISGELREHTGRGLTQSAARLETTVHGRLSLTCGGEDTILLGGAMTDTWTGGAFIAAAMSDDLTVGAGVRVTAPADIWLNALTGMEERPGTAVADGVYIDLCGTLFEREYGAGMHAAGIVALSGTIYQTQKTGFRPLMKVSMGVRNLLPGAGGAAAEPPPPAPPPAGAGAAGQRPFEPWYLAKSLKRRRAQASKAVRFGTSKAVTTAGTGMVSAGATQSTARLDSATNMVHVANAAQDMENAADLRHSDAAENLEELRHTAGDVDRGSGSFEDSWAKLLERRQQADLDFQRRTSETGANPTGLHLRAQDHLQTTRATLRKMLEDIVLAYADDLGLSADEIASFDNAPRGTDTRLRMREELIRGIEMATAAGDHDKAATMRAMLDSWETFARSEIDSAVSHADALAAWGGSPLPAHIDRNALVDDLTRRHMSILERMYAVERMNAGVDPAAAQAASDEANAYFRAIAQIGEGLNPMPYMAELEKRAMTLGGDGGARNTGAVDAYRRSRQDIGNILDSHGVYQGYGDDVHGQLLKRRDDYFRAGDFTQAWRTQQEMDRLEQVGQMSGAYPSLPESHYHTLEGPGDSPYHTLENPNEALYQPMENPDGALYRPLGDTEPLPEDEVVYDIFRREWGPAHGKEVMPVDMRRNPKFKPQKLDFVTDGRGIVVVGADTYEQLEQGWVVLRVHDSNGRRLSPQSYTIAVAGHEVAPSGDLYKTIDLSRRLPAVGDDPAYARLGDLGDVGRMDSLDDYSVDDLGEPSYARLEGPGEDGAPPLPPRWEGYSDAVDGGGELRLMDGLPDGDDLPPPVPLSSHPSRDPLPARVRFEQDGSFDGPIGAKPDDFDWEATHEALHQRRLQHRKASNWRGLLAYTEAMEELREELMWHLIEFGGDPTRLAPDPGTVPKAADSRKALQEMLEQAVEADDLAQMQRIGEFLEMHDQKTFETFGELVRQEDIFAGTRTGSRKGLDPHIDRQKVLDWIGGQEQDLMQRAMDAEDAGEFETMLEYHHSRTLYNQLHLVLSEGGDPLREVADQIVYLRAVDEQKEADLYLKLQGELIGVLSDPAYHKTAAEMGDATYSPLDFARFRFDPGEPIHEDLRPASFVDDPDGAPVPDFLHSAEADLPAGRAIQPLDPERDAGRHMLDVMPEQVATRRDSDGMRWQVNPHYERRELPPAELSPPPPSQLDAGPGGTPSGAYESIGLDPTAYEDVLLDPAVKQSPPSPQLDVDRGVATWTTSSGSELDTATGRTSRGDYADSVADGTTLGEDSGHVVSTDTQAVIDALPDRRSGTPPAPDLTPEDAGVPLVESGYDRKAQGFFGKFDLSSPDASRLTPEQREYLSEAELHRRYMHPIQSSGDRHEKHALQMRMANMRFREPYGVTVLGGEAGGVYSQLVVLEDGAGRFRDLNGRVIANNSQEYSNLQRVIGAVNTQTHSLNEGRRLYPDAPINFASFDELLKNSDNARDSSGRLLVTMDTKFDNVDSFGKPVNSVWHEFNDPGHAHSVYVTTSGQRILASDVTWRQKRRIQVVDSYHSAFRVSDLHDSGDGRSLYGGGSPVLGAMDREPVGFHIAYGNPENLRVDDKLVTTRVGDRYVTTGGDVMLVEDVHFWNRHRTVDADEFQTVIKTLEPPPEASPPKVDVIADDVRHSVPTTDIWDALDADMHRFGDTEPLALEGKPGAFRPVIGPGDAADSPEVLLEQWRQLAAALEESRVRDADFADMAAPGADPSDFAHLHREATDVHRVQVTGQRQRYASAADALAFAHRMLSNGEDPRPLLLASANEAGSVAEAEFMRALADDVTRMLIRESYPGSTAEFVDSMAEFYRAKHAEGVDPEVLAYADDLVALYRGESAPTTVADPVPELRPLGGVDPPALDETTDAPRLGDSGDALRTDVFGAEVEDPNGVSHGDGGVTAGTGDYAANRDAINAQVGPEDFARAPQQQPEGLQPEVNVLDTTDDEIDVNILEAERNAGQQEMGPIGSLMRETGETRGREAVDRWVERHGRSWEEPDSDYNKKLQRDFSRTIRRSRKRAYRAAQVEVANLEWAGLSTTDQRPFEQWYLAKNLKRRRGQISKAVRFGTSNLLTFRIEPESAGSKFRVAVDPVDTLDRSQAIRHVEAPHGWQPARQPGFDRTALAPGEFPFSAKERILNTLMQGKAFDSRTVDKLSDIFDEATTQHRITPQSKEWRNMASLIGDLRQAERASGAELRKLASAIDWRTLEKMLYMLDMSTMVA